MIITRFFSRFISKEKVLHLFTQLALLFFIIGTSYGIMGNDAFPETEFFALFLLAIAAYGGGLITTFCGLPGLLGMMIVGFLFRNLDFIPYHNDISIKSSSILRDISLVIILLKAGIGLDPKKLMELKLDVLKLSSIPCLIEAGASAMTVHYLLNLPWLWAVMLGFILSAVSAAVLVPGMCDIKEKKLGIENGIPTLIMASVSIDNIIALTGFIVSFSVLTSKETLTWTLIRRPIEPLIGFVLGAFVGLLLWYIPTKNTSKPESVYYRSLLLLFGGLSFQLVSKSIDLSGAGALGCVSLAFVASLEWRTSQDQFETIEWILGLWWTIIEPFLFGLIGAELTIHSFENNLGLLIFALILGILFRVAATVLALTGSRFNFKENVFVSASWLSKATVQAAVGSQALDYFRMHNEDPQFIEYSKQVLTISVLSIILTAPLGAAFIYYLAPRLLSKDSNSTKTSTISSESEEAERIAEVTVTDYGTRPRLDTSDALSRILQVIKPNNAEV